MLLRLFALSFAALVLSTIAVTPGVGIIPLLSVFTTTGIGMTMVVVRTRHCHR